MGPDRASGTVEPAVSDQPAIEVRHAPPSQRAVRRTSNTAVRGAKDPDERQPDQIRSSVPGKLNWGDSGVAALADGSSSSGRIRRSTATTSRHACGPGCPVHRGDLTLSSRPTGTETEGGGRIRRSFGGAAAGAQPPAAAGLRVNRIALGAIRRDGLAKSNDRGTTANLGGRIRPSYESAESGTKLSAVAADVRVSRVVRRTIQREDDLADSTKSGAKDGAPVEDLAPEDTSKNQPEHPSPPALKMDLASGQAVLSKAFGKTKTIVPGKIEILDEAGFIAAYDKIYGSGQWSWEKYVKPTYGGLNGFAYQGTNYINKSSAGLHTVVHEMLHNNNASDWTPAVGSRWNEGTTEVLTQIACAAVNEPAPVCYPGESPVVNEAIKNGLPTKDLIDAYLVGGAAEKVGGWVDKHCAETWVAVKGYMEAKDWASAKAGLAKKSGTSKSAGST